MDLQARTPCQLVRSSAPPSLILDRASMVSAWEDVPRTRMVRPTGQLYWVALSLERRSGVVRDSARVATPRAPIRSDATRTPARTRFLPATAPHAHLSLGVVLQWLSRYLLAAAQKSHDSFTDGSWSVDPGPGSGSSAVHCIDNDHRPIRISGAKLVCLDRPFQGGRRRNPPCLQLTITEVAHDRTSKRRTSVHLQHVCVPALGRAGDVGWRPASPCSKPAPCEPRTPRSSA